MLGRRGASNEKTKREIDWHPQYESWRRGFFEDLGLQVQIPTFHRTLELGFRPRLTEDASDVELALV
jgi:hypothetical protein